MQKVTLIWTRHNDDVESAVYGDTGVAIYKSGDRWCFNAWDGRQSDGIIFDSFDVPFGTYVTADKAKQAATDWITEYCNG